MSNDKKTFLVKWSEKKGKTKSHGTYSSFDEAMQGIREWWEKHNFHPLYVRYWSKGNITYIDYGNHNAHYEIHEL